jgi:hypothetical protein
VRRSEKRRNAPPIGAPHRALSGSVVHAPILGELGETQR